MTITTAEVWNDFSDGLRAFIARRIRSDEDADDILHDVFLKVHTKIGTLDEEERLAPWLYQIARNTLIDHYRRRSRAELPADVAETAPAVDGADGLDPAGEFDAAQLIAGYVRQLVETLPEHYREALRLTEFEGLTQVEMARRLGLSVSGAKSRVQRARAMLREQLVACCHFQFDRRGRVIDFHPLATRDEPCPECASAGVGSARRL